MLPTSEFGSNDSAKAVKPHLDDETAHRFRSMSSSSAKYGASKDSGLDDLAAESVKESGRDDEDEELSEEERLEVKRRCGQ